MMNISYREGFYISAKQLAFLRTFVTLNYIKTIHGYDQYDRHFSFLKTPGGIAKKLNSYAHKEYNKPEFKDEKTIGEKIKNKKDLFNRKVVLQRVDIDETYPGYILKNKNNYKEWIL